ncbi:MAG TPA: UDP-3-O-acyl-N-acetylglucosamine deacetylase [Caulobacteraceae bacterium]
MAFVQQHTLRAPVRFHGVGIHSGHSVSVEVRPAAVDTGIQFIRADVTDRDNTLRARAGAVCDTRLGTVIGNGAGLTVSTIEHLMASLAALGIDNAVVELDGSEVPIMDGSAAPFVRLLDRAGRRPQGAPRRYLEVLEPIEVVDGDKRVKLAPAAGFEVAFEIAFPSEAIGRQSVDLVIDEQSFREELADCRTFGFAHEVDALRAAGLARGGSLDNVVVIEGDGILNPEGLRRPDEFVRHKAVDAIGDLYLLGAPLLGRYEGVRAGHAMNNVLARAVIAAPRAWRMVPLRQELARAV